MLLKNLLIFLIYKSIFLRFHGDTFEIPKSTLQGCEAFNLETVKCFWTVYRINNQKINLDLYYLKTFYSPNPRKKPGTKCERTEEDTDGKMEWCTLHYRKHQITHTAHHFYLRSSSPELLGDSDSFYVEQFYDIVKTGRIIFDRANVTTHSASVHFRSPNKKDHFFELQLSGPKYNHTFFSNQTGMEVGGLRPNTLYQGRIRCVIYLNNKIKGSWSDWYSFYFKTKQDVPSAAPTFPKGAFNEIQPNLYKLFMEKVSENLKNGEILKSRIRVLQACHKVPKSFLKLVDTNGLNEKDFLDLKSSNGTYMSDDKISMPVFTETLKEFNYEVEEVDVEIDRKCYGLVFADIATSLGYNYSLKLKPLLISPNSLTLQKLGVERINSTVNSNGTFSFVWKSVDHAASYVFFYWLHASNQSSNFSKVETNNTSIVLYLANVPEKIWKFAISTLFKNGESPLMSSGMKKVLCVYNTSKYLDAQKYNLHYEINGNSVSLKWPSLDCSSSYPPFFSYYLVTYALANKSNEVEEKVVSRQNSKSKIENLSYGVVYIYKLYAVRAESSHLLHLISVPIPEGPNHWTLVACILLSTIIFLALLATFIIWIKNSKKTITVQTLPVEVTTAEKDASGYIQIYSPMKLT